jgi:predicted DNA-binding transcriptional regulator YafY
LEKDGQIAETTTRILSLLGLLQAHRQWSGPELAERLGVTERTLRRDVERVRELGYRVDAVRGPLGGYRLEAGGQLPPLLLTESEAVTMAIGLRVAAQQGLVDGELTTQSALAKFEQVLPPALRRRVNALATHLQAETPRAPVVSQELLGTLALACRDSERIRFSYEDGRGALTERVAEPHALVVARRNWFLVCFDLRRDDWRTFRVDRMSRLFGTRLRFEPREQPFEDAASYVAASVAAVRNRVSMDVLLRLPLAEAQAAFGPWGSQASAVDAQTTRWSVEGESIEHLFGALAWIPAGVDYSLEGDAELLQFVRAAAARAAASVRTR